MKAYGLRYNGDLISTDLELKKKDLLPIAEEIAKDKLDWYQSFEGISLENNTIIARLWDRRDSYGQPKIEFEIVKFKIK